MIRDLLRSYDQSCATLLRASPQHTSAPCLVAISLLKEKYLVFSLSFDLIWPGNQRNMWLLGFLYLTISLQLAKFCGHRPCHGGYIALLIRHVTTHHHIVRWSCNSIGGFLSPYITNLPSLVAIGLEEEEIFRF